MRKIAIVLAIFFSSPASAKVIFGYPDFSPTIFKDDSGKMAGRMVPKLKKLFWKFDQPVKTVGLSTTQYVAALADGSIHFGLGNHEIAAMKKITYLGKSTTMISRIVVLSDSKAPTKIYKDKKLRLALIDSYNYMGHRRKLSTSKLGHSIVNVRSKSQGIALLESKKVDAFLAYEEEVSYLKDTNKFSQVTIKESTIHYVVSKKAPNAKALLETINRLTQ